jgi:homoserine O-acetyltransferase/O-succinyltransferase
MKKYLHKEQFSLECGEVLHGIEIAYHTYGDFNSTENRVIWVCHALTANSDVMDWWKGLFGDEALFNPKDYFIVCANVLGGCYGTTGPLGENAQTGEPYYHDFPLLTIRDISNAHDLLRQHLGIENIHIGIGGSLGGQQILEWSIARPDLIENLILIATNAQHSPWGIAFNEAQRLAIDADQSWVERKATAGLKGLKAARATALLSYRNSSAYNATQFEDHNDTLDNYKASAYQQYQGDKLVNRFNAFTYWTLSKAMDSHNIGRGRGKVSYVLEALKSRTLVVGIESDILFPPDEQLYLAAHIPDSELQIIDSTYGHDGFLVETEKLSKVISIFLFKQDQERDTEVQFIETIKQKQ